ncbi:MAG: class I SAM-dependent methyltransferase [Saccharospirillaceae bacterium]|nr:class I SAM-dependent methyltransferase [Pseudomonadales bacterium]NRB80985.1 class I SAM-dependent methyltransferase [Saccharospirillaceae bacterium]
MNSGQKFWEKIAHRYNKQPIKNEQAYQTKLTKTKQYYNKNSKILEIGCGSGDTAIYHAPNIKHYLAVDYCQSFIQIGTAKALDIKNLSFIQCSVEQLDMKSLDFDITLAMSLFHLVENPGQLIQKIYDNLPENGLLISSTTCIKNMPFYISWMLPVIFKLGLAPKVMVFTSDELINMIKKSGFKIDYQWQPNKKSALFIVAKK